MAEQRFGNIGASSYGSVDRRDRYGDDIDRSRAGRGSFDGISRKISNLVFNINKNASELERSAKRLGTKGDNTQLRDRIHEIQKETNSTASEITRLIKQLHDVVHSGDKQQRLQVERLTASFKSSLERYSGIQSRVSDQMKSTSLIQAGTGGYDEDQDTWSEEANLIERERKKEQLQQQQIIIEDELAMARDREERIRQIETDILDVNEIFKELGTMVYEQGEMIDDIERNVSTASDNVHSGNEQLLQAEKYQKSYRKKLCWLAVIFIVIAGILALILGLTLKKK